MKILQREYVEKEIGALDGHLILPTSGRFKRGMETICKSCRKSVVTQNFLAGFKKGFPNMIFHIECVPVDHRGKGPL